MVETVLVASPWFVFLLSIKRADNIHQYNTCTQQENRNRCIHKIIYINSRFFLLFSLYIIYNICFPFLKSSSQSHLRSCRNILTKSGWFAMYDSNVSIFVTISSFEDDKNMKLKVRKASIQRHRVEYF